MDSSSILIRRKFNQSDLSAADPGWGGIALYSIPALGVAAPSMFVQFYFLNFATDGLLLAPAAVGAILAVGRIWDAISDPLVGYGSDRTRTRWGRRRPWMAIAAPATVLSFVALWSG
jgi:GPH family glycoside/pentoside/hexuronide:cation symporter